MRAIDREVEYAVNARGYLCKSNTLVEWNKGEITVKLHGNTIVKSEEGKICISDCGYATQTTAARINAALSGLRLPLSYSYGKGGYFTDSEGNTYTSGTVTIDLETRVITEG